MHSLSSGGMAVRWPRAVGQCMWQFSANAGLDGPTQRVGVQRVDDDRAGEDWVRRCGDRVVQRGIQQEDGHEALQIALLVDHESLGAIVNAVQAYLIEVERPERNPPGRGSPMIAIFWAEAGVANATVTATPRSQEGGRIDLPPLIYSMRASQLPSCRGSLEFVGYPRVKIYGFGFLASHARVD